jgi:hypothetical protein
MSHCSSGFLTLVGDRSFLPFSRRTRAEHFTIHERRFHLAINCFLIPGGPIFF